MAFLCLHDGRCWSCATLYRVRGGNANIPGFLVFNAYNRSEVGALFQGSNSLPRSAPGFWIPGAWVIFVLGGFRGWQLDGCLGGFDAFLSAKTDFDTPPFVSELSFLAWPDRCLSHVAF